jgi:hypothetical protein
MFLNGYIKLFSMMEKSFFVFLPVEKCCGTKKMTIFVRRF